MNRTELIQQFSLGIWAAVHGFARQPLAKASDGDRAYEEGYLCGQIADREGTFGRARREALCPCPATRCVALREQAEAEIGRTLPMTSDQVAAMNSFRVSGGGHTQETDL